MPELETVLLDRPGQPWLGAGEASQGPTAAAIANAIFDATGLRLRDLPLTPEKLREAALSLGVAPPGAATPRCAAVRDGCISVQPGAAGARAGPRPRAGTGACSMQRA